MIFKPHNYQAFATQHILDNESAGLFLDMGLGKTAITLTAVNKLMFEEFEITKALVIAPKRVAEDTWIKESAKWDHTKHLKISVVLGTERQRKEALQVKADIYVINRENVAWLVAHLRGSWPFDMTIIDELSSFKNPKSQRFKAMRTVLPKIKRMVGLTGTPAPNGLIDLWSQLYLLDQGERLGQTITSYRNKYFNEGKRNGHVVYNYTLKSDVKDGFLGNDIYEKEIYEKIGDICVSMKAKDFLDMPPLIEVVKEVHLSPKMMDKYLQFEKDLIMSISDEEEITALNAAALTNKLLQFSNGAVYDSDKNVHWVHDEKLEALEEDIEAANGKPVLVLYNYKHDVDRILKRFKSLKPVVIKTSDDVTAWNSGKIQLMVGHPASMGHGLNMQDGGNLLSWFGMPWGSELNLQTIARLYRQGQKQSVTNSRILCAGTMDMDVLASFEGKVKVQDAVMNAVKARIKKYRD
jgi:SNF2 family DNA or RNA helicase